MRFRAIDVYDYYRPSECRLRVYLRYQGIEEDSQMVTFVLL